MVQGICKTLFGCKEKNTKLNVLHFIETAIYLSITVEFRFLKGFMQLQLY